MDPKDTKVVTGAFHGEGDTDAGVVTESVVGRDSTDDDGLGASDDDEDESGEPIQADPRNVAGSDGVDRDKFERG